MGSIPDSYVLEFTDSCLRKLQEIEQIEHIDEALAELYHALRSNPQAFDFVPPLAVYRAAKTILYVREGLVVPPLTLYFVVKEEEKIVKVVDVLVRRGFGDLDF